MEGKEKKNLFGFIPVPEVLKGKERFFVAGLALIVAAAAIL